MKNKKQGSGTVYSAHTSATSGGDFGRYTKGSPKSKMQRNSSAGILWGLAAGVGAGVVAGILLAPKDGKTTRADWMNSANDLYGKASDLYEKAEAAITEGISQLTGQTNQQNTADSTVSGIKTDEGITNLPNM